MDDKNVRTQSFVDGIGYWNNCTKQYDKPIMACFDLVDNVFDAAPLFRGLLKIDVDVEDDKDDEDESRVPELELDKTNGFYMLNNCQNPANPMKDVLTCCDSDKVHARSQIGENGVGVKQGCATLSDISFAMSRNEQVYSLGILARSLQKKTGPDFPSFVFEFQRDIGMDLYEFLMSEIANVLIKNEDIASVMKEYGHGDVEKGTYRLAKNIIRMNEEEFSEEKYVFCICIHDLKHCENVVFLLNLKDELPKHYLHVPHNFQVWIGPSFRVKFNHWQSRLANLTRFVVKVPIDQEINGKTLKGTENDHRLNVYLGFDAIRIKSKKSSKTASLYFYSRKFGRHIKSEMDCRGTLLFSAGSSDYCQALTIIVDDKEGALPLMPNKQEFSFPNGKVWHSNMLTWVSAVTKVFWDYYFEKRCSKSKEILTKLVENCYEQATSKDSSSLQQNIHVNNALDELEVSTLFGLKWKYHSGNKKVQIVSKAAIKESLGADMNLLLEPTLGETLARSMGLFHDEDDGTNDTIISSVRRSRRSSKRDSKDGTMEEETDEQSHLSRTVASLISTNSVEPKEICTRRKKNRHRKEPDFDDNTSVIPHEKKLKELQMENDRLQQEIECLSDTLRLRDDEIRRLKMALTREKAKNSIVEL